MTIPVGARVRIKPGSGSLDEFGTVVAVDGKHATVSTFEDHGTVFVNVKDLIELGD